MMKRISRRKYAEALRCLKGAIKNEKLSWAARIRCVELLLSVYGVPFPDSGRRERKAVKLMVEERSVERIIREQVQAAADVKAVEDAEAQEAKKVTDALQHLRAYDGDAK